MQQNSRPVCVALINDYEVVVKGLRDMLAEFAERVQVVELDVDGVVEQPVDVALYDCFAAPALGGEDLARLVGQAEIGAVAVYTWSARDDLVEAALATGARGWLSKSLDSEAIVAALERLAAGATTVVTGEGHRLPEADLAPAGGAEMPAGDRVADWPGRAEGLSPRQSEIICLITQGLSNGDICDRTDLSLNTVKSYIREAYRTMGVRTRVQAVLWGVAHGMTPDRR